MIYSFRKKKNEDIETEFLEMLENNKEQFYRIAYTYLKNEHDTLDAIQESVCKAYESLEKLSNREYMKTWFVRILINTAINMIKKSQRLVLTEDVILEKEKNPNQKKYEEKIDLEKALDRLNDKEKSIVILRFFEDYKLDEISKTLDEPISSVKSMLYRSLKKMRLNFEEEYIYD